MVKRMKNTDRGFYGYMGKVFGSRRVQRDTTDRFYDDAGKEWIIDVRNGEVVSVISMEKMLIKNVYAEDVFSLIEILKSVYAEVSSGTVPSAYREAYTAAGYQITEEKKNFVVIRGGKTDE